MFIFYPVIYLAGFFICLLHFSKTGITLAVNLKHMDAIQPHELRIGNWVIGEDGNYSQIEQIVPRLWHIEPPMPIPLTVEILDKLGKRTLVFGDTSMHWIIDGLMYSEDDSFVKKGVHWFQNLHYFRTGNELRIEL